ncbi:hypothetical protein ACOMHN_032452 [Nucella lapillus]
MTPHDVISTALHVQDVMASGSRLQSDQQRLPSSVNDINVNPDTTSTPQTKQQPQTPSAAKKITSTETENVEKTPRKVPRPRPIATTSKVEDSPTPSPSVHVGTQMILGEEVAYDVSKYKPVSMQEGAGTFKVHTIPAKLLETLTTHEIVSVWPLLKYEIGRKIWGAEKFEPVPTVVEGAVDRYELGAVLFKSRRTPREKWRCLPPKCQALVSIYELIWDHDLTVDVAVEIAAPVRMQDEKIWPNHRFHGLVLKGGYCRQVTVTASGCHRVMPRALPRPDSLILNLYRYSGRYRTDRIYVITEVIYAQELHVSVRVSINRDDVKIFHRVPLAFKLHSYDVRDLSTLMKRRPYTKHLNVRWTGLTDSDCPTSYPRGARGMGDVSKGHDVRRNQGLEIFPHRNQRNQRNMDNGGDRQPQLMVN